MKSVKLATLGLVLTGCVQTPTPTSVGQNGLLNAQWVQIIDVDTHPGGGVCRGEGLESVPTEIVAEDNVFYAPLKAKTITIQCDYVDADGVSRTVERSLNEKSWQAAKNAMVAGALIGGGVFGAVGAATASPQPDYYAYPMILNVADPEYLAAPENVAGAIDVFERKWAAAMAANTAQCLAEGGRPEKCPDEKTRDFLNALKESEIAYLKSGLVEAAPRAETPPATVQSSDEEAGERVES